MNELFDDELRRRLKAYTEEPDPRLWESVASQIAADKPARRKKPLIFWLALGLVVSGVLYWSLNRSVTPYALTSVSTQEKTPDPARTDQRPNEKPVMEAQEKDNATATAIQQTWTRTEQRATMEGATESAELNSSEWLTVPAVDNIPIGGPMPATPSADSTSAVVIRGTSESEPINDVLIPERNDKRDKAEIAKVDATESEKQRRPLNLYFIVMPTMAYNRVEPNPHDNIIIGSIDQLAAFSTERLGVRAELGVERPISQRLRIFGGLVYFQRHQTIGYTEKVVRDAETMPGPNGGIIIMPEFNYVHKSFDHEVRNLGLQLGVNYQIRNAKFLHTAGTGIEFHRALNKSRPQAVESTPNPTAYVFYNLYYRLQYPAQTRLRGVVQPTLNYSFYINENLNAPFYIKPYGLGLNLGVTYNFLAAGY